MNPPDCDADAACDAEMLLRKSRCLTGWEMETLQTFVDALGDINSLSYSKARKIIQIHSIEIADWKSKWKPGQVSARFRRAQYFEDQSEQRFEQRMEDEHEKALDAAIVEVIEEVEATAEG